MEKKTIGIIGGMGPLATADLFQKIILHTKAESDQEHLHILIDNNTRIPDRSKALLEGGEDPFPQLLRSARLLESAGADCLVMPCNTAHNYHARLQAETAVPILNMIELTAAAMREAGIQKAALLAATGTARTGIYQRVCQRHGITVLVPEENEQREVMDMIYRGVKAGKRRYPTEKVEAAVKRLFDLGAQAAILGCTEMPLARELYGLDFPAVDATLELAKAAIRFAGGIVQ